MNTYEHQLTFTSDLITNVTYMARSFHITADQPMQSPPVTITQNGSDWSITAHCACKDSPNVAGDFNEVCEGQIHTSNTGQVASLPTDLSFCYGVIVTFSVEETVYEVDLFIGHGGHDTQQPVWWLGGANVMNSGKAMLLLISYNQIAHILTISSTPDAFSFAFEPVQTPVKLMLSALKPMLLSGF